MARPSTGKRDKILQLRQENPLMTSVEIGNEVRVSKQYVHKILKTHGMHTYSPHAKRKRERRQCENCGALLHPRYRFCSKECRLNYCYITLTCSFCKVSFPRLRGHIVQGYKLGYKTIFCSVPCKLKGEKDGLITRTRIPNW